jgi:hypothetical protein
MSCYVDHARQCRIDWPSAALPALDSVYSGLPKVPRGVPRAALVPHLPDTSRVMSRVAYVRQKRHYAALPALT